MRGGRCRDIFYPLLIWGVVPRVPQIWMTPHLAQRVAKDRLPGDPPVVLAGYVEPSLVFLLGSDTRIENAETAADVTAEQGGLAVIGDRSRSDFLARLSALGGEAVKVDELSGYNYSRGHREHVTLYRVTQAPDDTTPPAE